MLTQDRTVDDIYKLFAFIEKRLQRIVLFYSVRGKANCTQRTVIEWEYFEIGGWNGVKGE